MDQIDSNLLFNIWFMNKDKINLLFKTQHKQQTLFKIQKLEAVSLTIKSHDDYWDWDQGKDCDSLSCPSLNTIISLYD